MKKLICLLSMLAITVALTGCIIHGNNDGAAGNNDITDGSGNTNVADRYTLISATDGINLNDLSDSFERLTGKPVAVSSLDNGDENKIIIGETEHAVSKTAYQKLNRMIEDNTAAADPNYQTWILYYLEGSMCLGYTSDLALYFAAKDISAISPEDTELCNGIILSDSFDLAEKVNTIREERRAAEIAEISEEYGEELGNEIEIISRLFTENLYLWFADLYDYEIGGFYFSNSARNNFDFLPDIESTRQVLSFLSNNGMFDDYGGNANYALPEEMKKQMLNFVTSLQSPEDGYFYHPQWKDTTPSTRRSRDLKWARELILEFDGSFLYDTPLGDKGINGLPGKRDGMTHLTSPLKNGCSVSAVSKIVPAASLPSHLQSLDAFKNYVENELDLRYKSYEDGNKLNAMTTEIKAAGAEYVNYLISYLNSIQNPKNGSFEASDSSSNLYALVNGIMKIGGVYFEFGRQMPYYDKAIDLCMQAILLEGGENNITAVYNPWLAIRQILTTLGKTNAYEKDALYKSVMAKAPALVRSTTNKLSKYHMQDGSFTYSTTNIVNTANGVPAACAIAAEGSVNATGLASGAFSGILSTLGISEFKLYDGNDLKLFLGRIDRLGTIIKTTVQDTPAEVYTFDENPKRDTVHESGILKSFGNEEILTVMNDNEQVDGIYKWLDAEIVADPVSEKANNVLRTESFLDVGADKEKADIASVTAITMPQRANPLVNCFVYEADMFFESGSSIVGQLTFSSAASGGSPTLSLNIEQFNFGKTSYIRIGENYTGLDGIKNNSIVSGIPMNEWVHLRIEVYKISAFKSESGRFEIKGKIYVNGEYAGETDAGYRGSKDNAKTYYNNQVNYVNYAHYRHSASVTYFDNITTDGIYKEFEYGEVPVFSGLPISDNYDFDDGEMPVGVTDSIKSSGGRVEVVDSNDEAHKKVLSLYTNNGNQDQVRLDLMNVEVQNMNFFESDILLDFKYKEDTSEGTDDTISFSLYKSGAVISRVDFTNKGKYVGLNAYDYDGAHSYTVAKSGEWFTFRAEFYRISGKCYIRYFIDGILIHQFVHSSKYVYGGTTYSANLGFDNMRITSLKNCEAKILFDNMKMLHAQKEYVEMTAERSPVEIEIETNPPRYNDFTDVDTYPFDGSALPSHITGSLASTGASVAVNDGVLSFYSNNGKSDSLTVNILPSDEGNATRHAVFEADLYIDFDYAGDSEAGGEDCLRLSLMRGSASAGWLMLTKSADGKVALVDYSIGTATTMASQRLIIAEQREVFNFRLEYSYSAEVSGQNILKIFVDGTLVHIAKWSAEFRIPTSSSATCSRNVWFNKVIFSTTNSTELLMKMDNERLYITTKEYVSGEVATGIPTVDENAGAGTESGSGTGTGSGTVTPSEPSEPDTPTTSDELNDGAVFDGTVYNDSTKNVYTVGYEGASIPSAITQSLSSTGASVAVKNGVLEFYTNNGSSDYVQVGILEPSTANNRAYTFQTDICISDWTSEEEGATSGDVDQLEFDFRNGSDTTWILGLKRDGSGIRFVDYSSGSYRLSPVIATVGERFNLRLEWTFGTRSGSYGNNVMKIFVDNKLVFIANSGNLKIDNKMVIWSRINITNVRITAAASTELNVELDNTRLYSSDKAFVENEVPAFVYDESNNIVENPSK